MTVVNIYLREAPSQTAPFDQAILSSGPSVGELAILLGHTKLESTVRYLGIEVDDALVLSEQTDL